MDWHLISAAVVGAGIVAASLRISGLRTSIINAWEYNQSLASKVDEQYDQLLIAHDLLARFNAGILEYRTSLNALQVPEITRLKKDNPKRMACQMAFDAAAQNLADLVAESLEIPDVASLMVIMEAMKSGDLEETE